MISDETRAKLRAAGRKGGLARARQFTSEYQRAARARVRRESLQANGRKGYLAALATQGEDFARKVSADWRREHPTDLERIVIGWLDELGVVYQREQLVEGWYVDFVIDELHVIEVNGEVWHSNNALHGDDREGRDARKGAALAAAGIQLLWLSEQAITSGSGRSVLDEFLGEA